MAGIDGGVDRIEAGPDGGGPGRAASRGIGRLVVGFRTGRLLAVTVVCLVAACAGRVVAGCIVFSIPSLRRDIAQQTKGRGPVVMELLPAADAGGEEAAIEI